MADPNVGVRELQAVFVNFLKTQPAKDLLAVLGPSKSCKRVDWKSADKSKNGETAHKRNKNVTNQIQKIQNSQ